MMQRPILMIGILFMAIFLSTVNFQKHVKARNTALEAHSCPAALVQLNRHIPQSWKTECEGNDMSITITLDEKVLEKILAQNKDPKKLSEAIHAAHYRQLANSLTHIAKNCPNYTLERTSNIKVILETSKLKIGAYTHGQYLFKLPSLTDPTMIAEHLKATVQIKELAK
ncbi:MAG TPA: hypothetical protein DCY86_04470 [Bdellovibrionales bacterium]|nr:hypothetical protein [Bdellovibrionales bacterium]